jgi:hypothetical protein
MSVGKVAKNKRPHNSFYGLCVLTLARICGNPKKNNFLKQRQVGYGARGKTRDRFTSCTVEKYQMKHQSVVDTFRAA